MRKILPIIVASAVVAPLFLSAPAQAQSYGDIQRLEERVQDARQRGNWSHARQLERQLNQQRLQYQRRNGMGEYRNRGYNNYNYDYNRNYRNYDYDRRANYNNSPARAILPFAIDALQGVIRGNNNSRYYYPNNNYRGGYYDRRGNWRSY